MNRAKAIAGLCMLCAFAFAAFAAQSASAAGTTAFTCKEEATASFKYKDAHCKEESSGGNTGKFKHVAITEKTHAKITNNLTGTESEPAKLLVTAGGVEIELEAKTVESTPGAVLENGLYENAKKEKIMYSHGTGKLLLSGVAVKKPAGCSVVQGGIANQVETEELEATTESQPEPEEAEVPEELQKRMFLNFKPVVKLFAKFEIVGAGCLAAQTVEIFGSVKGRPNGATTNFTTADTLKQGTLRFGALTGPKVKVQGSRTVKAGKLPETEPTNPIAFTTE